MDSTRIDNRIGIRASAEQIWEVIEDLTGWQNWNPYERDVEGSFGFSTPLVFREAFPDLRERHVQASVSEWIPAGKLIWSEKRGFLSYSTRFILLDEVEKGATIITNGITFSGLRGEMFHDKHRARIRPAFVDMNARLKALLKG